MKCSKCAHRDNCPGMRGGCSSFLAVSELHDDSVDRARTQRDLDEYREAFADYAYGDGDYLQIYD